MNTTLTLSETIEDLTYYTNDNDETLQGNTHTLPLCIRSQPPFGSCFLGGLFSSPPRLHRRLARGSTSSRSSASLAELGGGVFFYRFSRVFFVEYLLVLVVMCVCLWDRIGL